MQYKLSILIISCIVFIACQNKSAELPKEQHVPTVKIEFLEKISWKTKIKCLVHYYNGKQDTILKGRIKLRGGISRKYPKHSFALELDKPYPLLGLKSDDDWIINSSYVDKTFMRHKLNYDLFRQMNTKNAASESAYFNLTIGDKEKGLHLLMEEINGGMLGIDKSDSMAFVFKDPPVYYTHQLKNVQDPLNYYQQKYPKKDTIDHTPFIENFIDFIFNSSDNDFINGIGHRIDLDNLIDWHLLLLLSNNGDGVMKNFLFYKINADTPIRIAIWDYDHAYGREGDNEPNLLVRRIDCKRTILIRRLMDIPESDYKNKLKKRWLELRNKNIISKDNIFQMISDNDEKIKNDLETNFKIWPINGKWYFSHDTYQEEIDLMKSFIDFRIRDLDINFDTLNVGVNP